MSKIRLAFLLGAGASVDSGLPTYRGVGGMYSQRPDIADTNNEECLQPEEILTLPSFQKDPKKVWDFLLPLYSKYRGAKSGPTYSRLNRFVIGYPDSFILTQNVDGFVRELSCSYVELHGNMHTARCLKCGEKSPVKEKIPECDRCKVIMRPEIVFFSENLGNEDIKKAWTLIHNKPTHFVIIGTGLHFAYLQNMVDKAKKNGAKIVHINPDPKYKPNIGRNEIWIQENSVEGLKKLEEILIKEEKSQEKTLEALEERVVFLEKFVNKLLLHPDEVNHLLDKIH